MTSHCFLEMQGLQSYSSSAVHFKIEVQLVVLENNFHFTYEKLI